MRLQEPRTTLRDYRVNFDLTLAAVAGHLHCDERHIAAIESGTTTPTTAEISILADLYGVSVATMTEAVDVTRMARKPRKKPKGGRLAIIERQSIS